MLGYARAVRLRVGNQSAKKKRDANDALYVFALRASKLTRRSARFVIPASVTASRAGGDPGKAIVSKETLDRPTLLRVRG